MKCDSYNCKYQRGGQCTFKEEIIIGFDGMCSKLVPKEEKRPPTILTLDGDCEKFTYDDKKR